MSKLWGAVHLAGGSDWAVRNVVLAIFCARGCGGTMRTSSSALEAWARNIAAELYKKNGAVSSCRTPTRRTVRLADMINVLSAPLTPDEAGRPLPSALLVRRGIQIPS